MRAPSRISRFPRAFGAVPGLQVCGRIMLRGSHGGRGWRQVRKGKPLLKCHAKGGEGQEPGPGTGERGQHQEAGHSEGWKVEGGRVSWNTAGLQLRCFL